VSTRSRETGGTQNAVQEGSSSTIGELESSGHLRLPGPELSEITHHAIKRVLNVEAGRRRKRQAKFAEAARIRSTVRERLGIDLDEIAERNASEDRYATEWSRRRLTLLNAIFLALEQIKGSVRLKHDEGEPILLWLRRASTEFRVDRIKADPTAPITLEVRCGDQVWRDQPGQPLEQQLTDIVAGLALEVEKHTRRRAARQAEIRTELATKSTKARTSHVVTEDPRWIATLRKEAKDHGEAELIRAYVARASAAPCRREGFEDWSARALAYADVLDPLTRGAPANPKVF